MIRWSRHRADTSCRRQASDRQTHYCLYSVQQSTEACDTQDVFRRI